MVSEENKLKYQQILDLMTSGKSQAAACEEVNVPYTTFVGWKRKLDPAWAAAHPTKPPKKKRQNMATEITQPEEPKESITAVLMQTPDDDDYVIFAAGKANQIQSVLNEINAFMKG